jgi:hypothetical protein
MPSICDLRRVRQRPCSRLTVAPTTIARHNGDGRMSSQPGPYRGALAVRQQRYEAPSLQIAHNRAVAVVAPERPIVNADNV